MKKEFIDRLGKELLFLDGAIGTVLQERGLGAGELPELWNFKKEDEILNLHRGYLACGSDIIYANTFGANDCKLAGSGYCAREVVTKGIELAKRAVEEAGRGYAALDIGPTGKLLRPVGDLGFEEAYRAFAAMVQAGVEAGAQLIVIETMSDTYEIKAALLAAKENSDLPVFATMTFDEQGKLLTGGEIEAAVFLLEGLGADAIGMNCGLGPEQMRALLPRMRACASVPIIAKPNAGLPVVVNGKPSYALSPGEFARQAEALIRAGASVVGGCCGAGKAHIEQMIARCSGLKPVRVEEKEWTAVSSYSHAVIFGERPVVIGERLNPTGKPKLKEALREKNLSYLYREGIAQAEHGADILDVNVGLPGIDEPDMMQQVVSGLQGILDLPLQIDTADPVAMERALRIYNGKPLLNSVNGKEQSMSTVLPLAKKYGAAVIALTLDENGIPDTPEGRFSIAKRIVERAEAMGIAKKNIIVDPLAMTISTGPKNALVTLETLRMVRQKLGVHTSLGISNISFGLPERDGINAAFFTMALQKGLSAGIINPASKAMMQALDAYCALIGQDEGCVRYVERYGNAPVTPRESLEVQMDLQGAVVRGLCQQAEEAAKKALEHAQPLEVVNDMLVPALDEVGKGFAAKRVFLPQLLMSAEAAKAAFGVVREALKKSGGVQQSKGKIVLATVKGDIHDIGKNIVKVLLENYGYTVLDLGKDVDPEEIAQTAKREGVKLVGLSALMTTTVPSMQRTIELLKQQTKCKVMVGGAVLTQDYANEIGADFYSPDAMGSVSYAEKIFSKGC